MKKIYFLLITILSGLQIFAQSEGDYRSRSDGNWNATNRWQRYISGSWTNVTDYPGQNAGTGTVTIMNGDDVTFNVSPAFSIGSLVIEAGNSASILDFNSGTTLNVTGSVIIEGGTGNGDDKLIDVGDGTLNCASITMLTTGNNGADSEVRIDDGNVTVTGDITMNDVATRNFIAFTNPGTLNIGGSFIGDGDIIPDGNSNGLVNYNGTSGTQIVKADTYADITFSGGAAKVIASGGIVITDDATFTNGIVTSGSSNGITFNNNATSAGASDASFVSGPVNKLGDDAFTFPIGKTGTGYQPLGITAPSSTSANFRAEYMRASGAALGPITAPGLLAVSNCEYWVLDRLATTNGVNVTLNWNANSPCTGSYITSLIGLQVSYFDGSNWSSSAGNGASGDVNAGSVVRNSVTTFGTFTIGNVQLGGSPLPVKISNISAFEKQNGIQINWTTYQEENLASYEVERSADGVSFKVIGNVSARNSVSKTDYNFFDANPLSGVSFYRLKNLDFDGKTGFSNIVKVNLDKSIKGISVYPNPVRNGYVSLQSADLPKGNYTIQVINLAGQQVYRQSFSHAGGSVNQTIQLPVSIRSGMYSLVLENGMQKIKSKQFTVQQ